MRWLYDAILYVWIEKKLEASIVGREHRQDLKLLVPSPLYRFQLSP